MIEIGSSPIMSNIKILSSIQKKSISLLCALLILILFCVPAYADQTFTTTGSKSITLEYSVSPSYIVTIPSTVDFSDGTASIVISVDSLSIGEGQSLKVAMSGSNYSNNKWYLQDTASATNLISYSVKLNGNDTDLTNNPTINALSVNLGTAPEDRTKTFNLAITGEDPIPGTYQDILTFSCTITP